MPYQRRSKKRSRKKRTPYTRTGGLAYLTDKGESKFVDIQVGGTEFVLPTAGTWKIWTDSNPCSIAQGTGASQRVGRQVLIKKILFKGRIEVGDATFADWDGLIIKVALVIDKQTNKAQFNITDLWEADDIYHYRNLDQAQRFRVLMLKTINVTGI